MARLVRETVTALGRIRSQKLTPIGRTTSRSLSYVNHGFDIRTARFVEYAIECQKNTGIVAKSLNMYMNTPDFDDCSLDTKLKVLSKVFDRIRNYPQADPYEVYLMKIYLSSMRNDDSKYHLTKEEIISRLFDLIQSHPKVCRDYKVTEETHFGNDLGFDDLDCKQLHKAIYLEFKLYIPIYKVEGYCKESVDCIYENQSARDDFEEFRKYNKNGVLFWPFPLM